MTPTVEERLTTLEVNDKNIFHQLDEIKEEQKDQRRLVVAVEQLATKTDAIGEKVDRIDARIANVEAEPGKRYNKLRDTIISCIVTGIVGAILGAVLALILK